MEETRQLISVVVPIYNSEEFIGDTILTVLDQSYPYWELLLIDDGSTDRSKDICNSYVEKDERIKYYYKSNGGQASARNLGIEKSQGEWIALLDSDDLWHKEKLEKQIKSALSNKEVLLVYTNISAFKDDLSNEVYTQNNAPYGLIQNQELFQLIFNSNHISNSSLLINKSVFETIGFLSEDKELIGSEDYELLLRYSSLEGNTFGVEEKLMFYRLHDGGVHFNSLKMLRGKKQILYRNQNNHLVNKVIYRQKIRYVFRELINELWRLNKKEELKTEFEEFCSLDRGPAIFFQKVCFKLFGLKTFMFISKKIIYRLAYRLEK